MFKKLKSLFKKKSTVVELPKTKIEESQLDFPIDRADYFFDHALVFYCEENDIPSEKLSKSDMLEISKRAAFHLSVFVAWLAKHDFLNPQSDGFNPEDAQKLKNETITGTDYLFKHLDEKLYLLTSVTHSSPSSLIFMKIIWISVIQSWLMMLLELNLIGKSITWLKMTLTRCSVNIRTSNNMKNASLKSREAFSYFQNFAFEAATQADRQARATTA